MSGLSLCFNNANVRSASSPDTSTPFTDTKILFSYGHDHDHKGSTELLDGFGFIWLQKYIQL